MKKLLTFLTLLTLSIGVGWATTVTKTISEIASANGWINSTKYDSFSLDANITVSCTGGGNTGKYYTSGYDWRLYQNESASMTITAATGSSLQSVSITYNSSNGGRLLYGSTVLDAGNSPTTIHVSGSSVTFSVGNSGTATNGQARVTEISVTYETGGTPTQTVATPSFSPEEGTYTSAQNVTISCSTSDATIHYTTDGSNPTTSSAVYSSAIPVSETTTIKAMAVKSGMNNSNVATATYTITNYEYVFYEPFTGSNGNNNDFGYGSSSTDGNGNTPVYVNPFGAFTTTQSIYGANNAIKTGTSSKEGNVTTPTITGLVSGKTYILTFKAAPWAEESTTMAVAVVSGGTISGLTPTTAMAVRQWNDFACTFVASSSSAKFTFTASRNRFFLDEVLLEELKGPAPPTIIGKTPFVGSTEVTIVAEDGASIYYTTNGDDPTTVSTLYNAPFTIEENTTVKAIAVANGVSSIVASYTFTALTGVSTVSEFNELAENTEFGFIGTGLVAIAQNSNNLYAQDATGGMLIYGNIDQTYGFGNVIPAGFTGKRSEYQTVPEVTNPNGFEASSTTAQLTPLELTPTQVDLTNMARYVVIRGATFDSENISVGDDDVPYYNSFGITLPSDGTKEYDITGVIGVHNGAAQILPLEFHEVVPGTYPEYYLIGSFNNWTQKDENYKFTRNPDNYTLNGKTLPDGVEFKIIKVQSDIVSWYGGPTNDNTYGLHGGWHTNIPMNGDKNYYMATGGESNFTIYTSTMTFDVEKTKLFLRKSSDNWTNHEMTPVEGGGWTLANESFAAETEFHFVDGWNDQRGSSDGYWIYQENDMDEPLTLTKNQPNFKMVDAGNYILNVNKELTTLVVSLVAYNITVADGIEKGTVSVDKNLATPGETVTITATPINGYELTALSYNSITIDVVEGQTEYTFVMPGEDVVVNATFSAKSYPISVVEIDGTGVVDIPTSASTGQTVNFTVTPPTGYTLISVTASFVNNNGGTTAVTVSENEGTYSFGMPPFPVTVTVTYEAPAMTVTPPAFYSWDGEISVEADLAEDESLYIFNEDYYEDAIIYYMIDPASAPTKEQLKANGTEFDYDSDGIFFTAGQHHVYAICEYNGVLSEVAAIIINVYEPGDWKLVDVDTYFYSDVFDYIVVTADHTKVLGTYENGHFNAIDCEGNVTFDPNYGSATINNNDIKLFSIETKSFTDDYGHQYKERFLKDNQNIYYNFANSTVNTGETPIDAWYNYSGSNVILRDLSGTISLGYNDDTFGIYENGAPIIMYYRPKNLTLAELIANTNGPLGGSEFTIQDELVAVECIEVEYPNGSAVYLWCKDQGNISIEKTTNPDPEHIEDYMKANNFFTGDWDQSNWVAVEFWNADVDEIRSYVGSHIKAGTLKGTCSFSRQGHELFSRVNTLELEENAYTEYTPNLYCAANFLTVNHNGNATGHGNYTNKKYFFVNPKIDEICEITFAVWTVEYGWGYFTLPAATATANTTDIYGAFNVDWEFNKYGDVSDYLYNNPGKVYRFKAIVREPQHVVKSPKDGETVTPQSGVQPDGNYIVYPYDFQPEESIITSIETVNFTAGNGYVKSVKYVNVAGIVSDTPFQGVNIVVTEYTDGSRTTTKMLKR